jgi:3-deoxy-manno-octulosonate cytidylyltransferase (CMP-KDO synthetase)
LADIGGEPMLKRVLDRCRLARCVSAVVLCTDSQELSDYASSWGHHVLLQDEECCSGTERIARALPSLIANYFGDLSLDELYVMNVQADQPFLSPGLIERLSAVFASLPCDVGVVTPVYRLSAEQVHDPAVVKVLATSDGGRAITFSRSALPHVHGVDPSLWHQYASYWGHIGVYGFRADILSQWQALPVSPLESIEGLEQLRLIDAGYTIGLVEEQGPFLSVDTAAQLEQARRQVLAFQ